LLGLINYHRNRLTGRASGPIEHKPLARSQAAARRR
jgi:hypothetical protein